MKRRLVFIPPVVILILLMLVVAIPKSVHGEPNASFIINYADATNTFSMTSSAGLFPLLQNVENRFVIQYANASKVYGLLPIPDALFNVLQFVEDRFVILYANASNTFSLGYPIDLIGDTTKPTITNIDESPSGGSMLVTVTSSEYTLAELQYGTSSGNYPNSLDDELYRYSHTFTLPKPESGETLYYRVILTDRSSNVTTSSEYTIEPLGAVYLPILRR